MGIKGLGYVVVETARADKWDHFMTQFAGAMRAPDAADGNPIREEYQLGFLPLFYYKIEF